MTSWSDEASIRSTLVELCCAHDLPGSMTTSQLMRLSRLLHEDNEIASQQVRTSLQQKLDIPNAHLLGRHLSKLMDDSALCCLALISLLSKAMRNAKEEGHEFGPLPPHPLRLCLPREEGLMVFIEWWSYRDLPSWPGSPERKTRVGPLSNMITDEEDDNEPIIEVVAGLPVEMSLFHLHYYQQWLPVVGNYGVRSDKQTDCTWEWSPFLIF